MIDCKVTVTIYFNTRTKEVSDTAPKDWDEHIYNSKLSSDYPWVKRIYHFSKFTDNNKLTESDFNHKCAVEDEHVATFIKQLAEKQSANLSKIAQATSNDMNTALELKKEIDSANWDVSEDQLAVIEVRYSHSKWYQNDPNLPSVYLTLVPVSVAPQAKELQAIRRKHQNDSTFDLRRTNYHTQEIKLADHSNEDMDGYLDTSAEWTQIYNCEFIH